MFWILIYLALICIVLILVLGVILLATALYEKAKPKGEAIPIEWIENYHKGIELVNLEVMIHEWKYDAKKL